MTTSTIYNLIAIGFLLYVFLFVIVPLITVTLGNFLILRARKPAWAAALFTIMLKPYLRSSSFYVMRSLAYLELRKYQQAIQDCNKAISLKAKLPTPYNNRGVAHCQLDQYELAIQDLNHAIELMPSHALAHKNRAQTYRNRATAHFRLQHYHEALQDLDHALNIHPNFAQAISDRGYMRGYLRQYQEALQDLNHAIAIAPKLAQAYSYRGFIYLNMKDYRLALQDFEHALMLNPKVASYYNGRGNIYMHSQDYQRALEDFEHAITLAPTYTSTYATSYHNRGETYLCLNDIAQAKADFRKSLELDPKSIVHNWMMEVCILCFESPDEEMPERLEKLASLDINPQNSNYYLVHGCRGWAYWLRGQFAEALAEFEQAIVIAPYEDIIYIWVGMACAALGRDEEAKAAFEHARKSGAPDYMFRMLKLLEQTRPDFVQQYAAPSSLEQATVQN